MIKGPYTSSKKRKKGWARPRARTGDHLQSHLCNEGRVNSRSRYHTTRPVELEMKELSQLGLIYVCCLPVVRRQGVWAFMWAFGGLRGAGCGWVSHRPMGTDLGRNLTHDRMYLRNKNPWFHRHLDVSSFETLIRNLTIEAGTYAPCPTQV